MRFSWEHLVAIGGTVLVVLLAWFSGSWFHVTGLDRAILSGGIMVIGAACIGGFLLWAHSKQPVKPSASLQAPSAARVAVAGASAGASFAGSALAPEDIHLLIREAESKVASARLGHGAKLASLRVIFVLGEAGSGKTTAILHSGLDPELLAGQVFQEGAVAPTPVANFWFARKSVLVEAGHNLLSEPRLWVRLVQRLTPRGLGSVLGRKTQGERAALVCFDCETLANLNASDSIVASARSLRARLEEMSQSLGSSFPVYVLFTRADRLPFFDDFVGSMTNEESSQVFGVTLPLASDSATSVYADRETKRLTTAFNSLFFSLADHRPGLLSRERNAEKQSGVYEFPRQFRKLANPAVKFLVNLCRPSQLRAGPFLRGFYFTGVRTVASNASSPTGMATRTSFIGPPPSVSNATSILRQEDLAAMPSWQSGTQIQGAEGRKVTAWAFTSHIFSQVLLQDRGALGASSVSTRVNFWRRALLITAAILCFVWILGLITSYFSNRALESDFVQAAHNFRVPDSSTSQPASLESLQQLETLRKSLAELTGYERNGAPLHLHWGVYPGHDFYPEARGVYFLRFRQLLFGQIQASLLDTLRRLPASPGPNDEYVSNYDTLKAYLITTSNPEKSTSEFLSPVLEKYRIKSQRQDINAQSLARAQFDFYADELKVQNPYVSVTDALARDHARDYLNHFGAVPRIYTAMQNATAKQNPPVNFYGEHPDATDLIRFVPQVPGAFSKGGWDFMQNAIAHSDQYFRGEEWVLGGASEAIANRAELETQLRAMYQSDFIKHWQDFLKSAKVAPYGGVEDEIRKLKKLSANESPLISLLCYASFYTAGRSTDMDTAFRPVQLAAPAPACGNSVPPILIPYVGALAELQNCLETLVAAPPDQKEIQRQQCNTVANKAKLVVATQIMPGIGVDSVGHINQTVQQLLEAPIAVLIPPPTGSDPKSVCDPFTGLSTKYPFNLNNDQDASIQEFDKFFNPDNGPLQKFIQANQSVLVLQGTQYVLKPGTKSGWNPTFLPFLNRAHSIQQSLYATGATGSAQLQYRFNVRATLPEGGITGITFALNGQTLNYPGGSQTTAFIWPGNVPYEARIGYRAGGAQETDLQSKQGPWAIIKLLSLPLPGAKVTPTGSGLSAEWHALQSDGRTPLTLSGSGKPIVVHLDFESGVNPFVLQGGYFSNLTCRANR